MFAVDADFLEVRIPDPARVFAQVVVLADQMMPGALYVPCCERLAVMPFDTLAQIERQLCSGSVPRPALSQLWNDVVDTVARLGLIEQHQVVEYGHERHHRGDGGLFENGGARRIAAGWLLERHIGIVCVVPLTAVSICRNVRVRNLYSESESAPTRSPRRRELAMKPARSGPAPWQS